MSENGTVYIVDDDQAIRDVIANLVKDMGISSQTYASAEEFLSSYKRIGTDCLVLDVRMAGMSGMELLEKLSDVLERSLGIKTRIPEAGETVFLPSR